MKKTTAVFLIIILVTALFLGTPDTVSPHAQAATSPDNTQKSMFLYMLSKNYNFDSDFKDDATVIENTMLALIEKADDDGNIDRDIVLDLIYNLYGFRADENAYCEKISSHKDNSFYIVPRGYTTYLYEIVKTEDYGGGVLATCNVTAGTHDAGKYSFVVEADFVKNADACFGYNIVSCRIIDNTSINI